MLHARSRAIVSIKCGHPLKFDEIVLRSVAQVQSDSISAILCIVLHATISMVDTSCILASARKIACNVASCGQPLTLSVA